MKKTLLLCSLLFLLSCNKNHSKITSNGNKKTELNKHSNKEIKPTDLIKLENQIIKSYIANTDTEEGSENFKNFFFSQINKNSETINFAFNKLQKETPIKIASSKDKKFRVYSWDNNSGGTMRFFDQIYQFESNNKILSKLKSDSEDPLGFISKIFEVRSQKNEIFYLVLTNSIFSTSSAYQSLDAYKIENEQLIEAAIFNTKKDKLSSIDFDFDFFSVVDRPERPVELIQFSDDILKIPLIDKEGQVTSKFLIYKWDGFLFNYEGVK